MIITGRSGSTATKTRADIVIVLGRSTFMSAQDVTDCDVAAGVVIANLDGRRATLIH